MLDAGALSKEEFFRAVFRASQISMRARELDVVVYGATGFTGRLIASYLARRGGGLRVGLAGRSFERLSGVRTEAEVGSAPGWDPPLLAAAADDADALAALAARTRVIISAAGPFTECGTTLVGACVRAGTDYVDINGEVPWVRGVIDAFDEAAASSGTFVVPCCGYTVPADLGVLHAVQALGARHGAPARAVRTFMQFNGRLSGGTMATGILLDTAAEPVQAARREPFLLGGAPSGLGAPRPEDTDPAGAESDGGHFTTELQSARTSARGAAHIHSAPRRGGRSGLAKADSPAGLVCCH